MRIQKHNVYKMLHANDNIQAINSTVLQTTAQFARGRYNISQNTSEGIGEGEGNEGRREGEREKEGEIHLLVSLI